LSMAPTPAGAQSARGAATTATPATVTAESSAGAVGQADKENVDANERLSDHLRQGCVLCHASPVSIDRWAAIVFTVLCGLPLRRFELAARRAKERERAIQQAAREAAEKRHITAQRLKELDVRTHASFPAPPSPIRPHPSNSHTHPRQLALIAALCCVCECACARLLCC
jgi:hypothetical protein